jgi:hypothetical protein
MSPFLENFLFAGDSGVDHVIVSDEAANITAGGSGMARKQELRRHEKMAKYVIQAKRGAPPRGAYSQGCGPGISFR